jgi:hypothetical protein
VVIQPFSLDGAVVRSSEIRKAIGRGDLAAAQRMLGRPVGVQGELRGGAVVFDWPMAMPPDGDYPCRVDGRPADVTVRDGTVRLDLPMEDGPFRVEFLA